MSIALVTDSTADLTRSVREKINVNIVPLYLVFGETSLKQDVDINTDTFYEKQAAAENLPSTSQPTPADFKEMYERCFVAGADTVISIHISAEMSGTYQSARQAAAEMKDSDIRIIDSRTASVGLAALVCQADALIKSGIPTDEIIKKIEEMIPRIRLIFYVGTLEFLKKNGRIGGARALLGTLLNLKLILQIKDGKVQPMQKLRSKAKLFRRMAETFQLETSGSFQGDIFIAHGNVENDFAELKANLPSEILQNRAQTMRMGGVIGAHSGPEVIGMGYILS